MLKCLIFIVVLSLTASASQNGIREQIESDNIMSVFAGYFVVTSILIVGCGSAYILGKRRIFKKVKRGAKKDVPIISMLKNRRNIYSSIRDQLIKETSKYFKPSEKKENPFSNDIKNELFREIHSQISYWVLYESVYLSHRLQVLSDRVDLLEKSSSPEIDNIKKEADEISRELAIFKKHFSGKNHLLNG